VPGGRKLAASNATDNIMRSPDARAWRSDTRMKAKLISLALAVPFAVASVVRAQDPLPSWNVLAYLRAKGFKTCIVSGGGIDFMRAWVERAYGIPPE
jgi:phosphoserine phosphatase